MNASRSQDVQYTTRSGQGWRGLPPALRGVVARRAAAVMYFAGVLAAPSDHTAAGAEANPTPSTQKVTGRVVDAVTGETLPARVHLQSEQGEWYFLRSASPEGTAVEYRRQPEPASGSVEMHTTLSAHPFHVDLFELSNNHLWQTQFGFPQWTLPMAAEYMHLQMGPAGFTEWGWTDFGFQTYYALLNCGFRMRVTAGTASGVHPVQLGFGRVYVHCPTGFSYDDWIAGLSAGRSFVSTGPMLEAKFNGRDPGERFERHPRQRVRFAHTNPVHVQIGQQPLVPRREEVEYLVGRMEEELERNQEVLTDEALQEYRDALEIYRRIAERAL